MLPYSRRHSSPCSRIPCRSVRPLRVRSEPCSAVHTGLTLPGTSGGVLQSMTCRTASGCGVWPSGPVCTLINSPRQPMLPDEASLDSRLASQLTHKGGDSRYICPHLDMQMTGRLRPDVPFVTGENPQEPHTVPLAKRDPKAGGHNIVTARVTGFDGFRGDVAAFRYCPRRAPEA